jgi:hypothetical protein
MASGGKSEKSTELNGSLMLATGGGVPGPPNKMAPAKTATNRPKQIRKMRFTALNEKEISYSYR